MKIFFITHTYAKEGGGSEIFVGDILTEMTRRGHELFVFTVDNNQKLFGINDVYGVKCYGHHATHKYQYILHYKKAIKIARKFGADIVHAQNDCLPGIIGHKVKNALTIPMINTVELLTEKGLSFNTKLHYYINKFFLPKLNYNYLVSWSTFMIEKYFLKWSIDMNRIKYIPGAVNTDKLRPNKQKKKKWITSVKPLHKTNAEGIKLVIRAMKYLSRDCPEWQYHIFGNGSHRKELEHMVSEMGLSKNVFFHGNVSHEKVLDIYNQSGIVIHPFVYEPTTSIGLLESMACGSPVVATAVGEVGRILYGTGGLAQPNPWQIYQKLFDMITDEKIRKNIAKIARKKVVEKYSIKKVTDSFEKMYGECL